MRHLLLLSLLVPATGCVVLHAPTAAPPGSTVPTTEEGSWEATMGLGAHRNTSFGAAVDSGTGELIPNEELAPIWPAIDFAYARNLKDGIGLDLRWTWSWILPIPPIPVPSGFTVAPSFLLSEVGSLRVHTSPRFIRTSGSYTVAFDGHDTMRVRSHGLELPFSATWIPGRRVAVNTTAWGRAFLVSARTERTSSDSEPIEHRNHWTTASGGLTLHLLLTLGRFRLGLGGGLEVGPNPGARLDVCATCTEPSPLLFFPQLGLTLGAARVVPPGEVPVPEVEDPVEPSVEDVGAPAGEETTPAG